MKRILTVQDISCVGKCSLTVALPVLSAMGVETAVLPTSVLSTHTAFPAPVVQDLTGLLVPMADHWQRIGAKFDGVYTGYLGSEQQVDAVLQMVRRFAPQMLFVDPVMGDNGRLYSGLDSAYIQKMRALCAKADVLVPNMTEACFLTDTPYREDGGEAFIGQLLEKLTAMSCGIVLITGVSFEPGKTGVMGCNGATGDRFYYGQDKLPESYHGTGDVFSSVCAGALLLEKPWQAAVKLAADFTAECIRVTMEETRDKRFGVCFEKALPGLIKGLE